MPLSSDPAEVWGSHPYRLLEPRLVLPSPPPESAWKRYGRNVLLFVLTAASIYLTGAQRWGALAGLKLVAGLVSILLAHEMGHYLACRYYGIDATLPFFIPSPWGPFAGLGAPWVPVSFVGTFGAVIRIRSPFPHRRALFDVGIAGPLAGFFVCLPVLALGILEGRIIPVPPGRFGDSLGEPLLFQWATGWLLGQIPEGMTLELGATGLAAWFGLFVTALNLIPIGQLDGGHVTYALFGRRALTISRVVWWACVGMIFVVGPTWILWSILVRLLGMRHPRTVDDETPVGRARAVVGLLGLAVFVLCFLPNPFLFLWSDLFPGLKAGL